MIPSTGGLHSRSGSAAISSSGATGPPPTSPAGASTGAGPVAASAAASAAVTGGLQTSAYPSSAMLPPIPPPPPFAASAAAGYHHHPQTHYPYHQQQMHHPYPPHLSYPLSTATGLTSPSGATAASTTTPGTATTTTTSTGKRLTWRWVPTLESVTDGGVTSPSGVSATGTATAGTTTGTAAAADVASDLYHSPLHAHRQNSTTTTGVNSSDGDTKPSTSAAAATSPSRVATATTAASHASALTGYGGTAGTLPHVLPPPPPPPSVLATGLHHRQQHLHPPPYYSNPSSSSSSHYHPTLHLPPYLQGYGGTGSITAPSMGGGIGIGIAAGGSTDRLPSSPPTSPYERALRYEQNRVQLLQNAQNHRHHETAAATGAGAASTITTPAGTSSSLHEHYHRMMNPHHPHHHLLGSSTSYLPSVVTGGTMTAGMSPISKATSTTTADAATGVARSSVGKSSAPLATTATRDEKKKTKKRTTKSSSSGRKSPSSPKKPKLGPRRSTEDMNAATLLASMMTSEQQQGNYSSSSDGEDGQGRNGGDENARIIGARNGSEDAGSPGNDHVGLAALAPSFGPEADNRSTGTATPTLAHDIKWYHGSISLHLPEDDDVLSPLHCFMRRYCVEAFSARQEDVATPRYGKSHGFKVEVGQVGLRCLYCKDLPISKRPERAVCYPSSLRNIYHSIETWQRRHAEKCHRITPWVRKSIAELMESSKTRAGGRRQYWEDSAKRLGLIDTSHGVRFSRPPGEVDPVVSDRATPNGDSPEPKPVVKEEDKELVTQYLFLLMEQMQTCCFTEEDRSGGRSKIKDNEVGFPGMECRHCRGRAGFGRYFPTSVSALSLANSDRNIFNHLQKCRRCPTEIKSELVRLSKEQGQSKNRRGLRKLFFHKVWQRIHPGDEEQDQDKPLRPRRKTRPDTPESDEEALPKAESTINQHPIHMPMTSALHGPMAVHAMTPMTAGFPMAFAAVPVSVSVPGSYHPTSSAAGAATPSTLNPAHGHTQI